MRRFGLAVLLPLLVCAGSTRADFINPSFETGDFTGWATADLAVPFFPLSVQPPGTSTGFFSWSSTPTDGNFVAFSGFDGEGPGVISVGQDIAIPAGTSQVTFDWRAGWVLSVFGATQNRTFDFDIQPAGGGANLFTQNIVTAIAGTDVDDTGPQTTAVDVSAFAGQTVRVSFDLTIPENFTGPAQWQLDNVHLATAVPEPSSLVLLGIGGIGLVGGLWRRGRKVGPR